MMKKGQLCIQALKPQCDHMTVIRTDGDFRAFAALLYFLYYF